MKFLVVALALTSFTALAAKSDKLHLKGKVKELVSIEVTPELIATDLPLDISQTNTKVAMVNEKSNAALGYKVTITSDKDGMLEHSNGIATFPYTLKYDGVVVDFSSTVTFDRSTNGVTDDNVPVRISYNGIPAEEMLAGVYTDTITFTIAAN